ncbi:hypothetical protein CTA1_2586 [Colletotrichum tanaceti]|uniref:Uncharacterized protein n=1 Tax=Colletotrichum tanaceti TaxID=1306861 RepID=A0A4U6XHJ8_9PEZI|nr:hypothetical protein CTA1_2586 [Colletotrichum tanaceti]
MLRGRTARPCPLQLDVVVEDAHLLAGLKRRQADVGAAVAAEGVAESAVAARADLALDGEVNLGEVVGAKLDSLEGLVGGGTGSGVLSGYALGEAAGTVLAGATAPSGLGGAFGGCFERLC